MKHLALLTIFTPVTFAAPVRNRSIRTPSLLIYDGPRLSAFRVRDNGGKFNSPKGGVSPPKPVYHVGSDFDYQSIVSVCAVRLSALEGGSWFDWRSEPGAQPRVDRTRLVPLWFETVLESGILGRWFERRRSLFDRVHGRSRSWPCACARKLAWWT